jgi:hypothetical protein
MILKILIIIFIIIIFYLIINYNYEYFIDNSRNTNEYSWERNEINSSLPYDIKLKNKESNLYDYGNDEYERKLKEIFDISTLKNITVIESCNWSEWINANKMQNKSEITNYYNNIYKYISNKINNSDLLKLPNNDNILIHHDKLIRIKKNNSYYMFDIEMVLYRNKKPLGKHIKFIVVSNNITITVIFVKIIGVINEYNLNNVINAINEEDNYTPYTSIKKIYPDMSTFVYEGNDKLVNSQIDYAIYKKLLNSPDTTDIIIPDPYIIESAEDNNEYTKNMIEVRNSFLSKLK